MRTRVELQALLEELLGSKNVYFQPPESLKINYPAIVYSLDRLQTRSADDIFYKRDKSYELKYISTNPDNDIFDKMLELPYCRFDRRFIADNLYHDCFSIYF